MSKLFARNNKLSQSSGYTVNFGIPALKTCPMADECKDFCYANKGAYKWPVVAAAYNRRFEASKKTNFIQKAVDELSRKKKLKRVRIHDSGDFYNKEYLYKWYEIAKAMPHVQFYAYTKRVKLLKDNWSLKPKNLVIIFSLGGKEDFLIDTKTDRHSRIFESITGLKQAGYINASKNDTKAVSKTNHKIGLVIH